jgi:hypothetical protein
MKKPVSAPDRRRTRTRHRKVTALALSASVVAGCCLSYVLFAKDDSDAVSVDGASYYQFVSARSGNALDVAGADDADGVRIQQEHPTTGSASQQWQVKAVGDGYYQLVNHNSSKVLGVRDTAAGNVEQQSDTGARAPSNGRSARSATTK